MLGRQRTRWRKSSVVNGGLWVIAAVLLVAILAARL
jgi:hypothetical protein